MVSKGEQERVRMKKEIAGLEKLRCSLGAGVSIENKLVNENFSSAPEDLKVYIDGEIRRLEAIRSTAIEDGSGEDSDVVSRTDDRMEELKLLRDQLESAVTESKEFNTNVEKMSAETEVKAKSIGDKIKEFLKTLTTMKSQSDGKTDYSDLGVDWKRGD